MNIGIIVYSRSGHTLSVAQALQKKLSAAGHTSTLEQVEAIEPVSPTATHVELKTRPEIDAYEALVFGAPSWGGTPPPPLRVYLEGLGSLEGKKVACLATGIFPASWGRNQTLGRIQEICESKGATVCGSGSVGWWGLRRKRQIAEVADRLSALF
jgi:flavodoxin